MSHVDENRIDFTPDPAWEAYNVLDKKLAFHQRESYSRQMPDIQRIAEGIIGKLDFNHPKDLMHWFPDFGTGRGLMSPVNGLLTERFLLPQSWVFDGITVLEMRNFWRAAMILALIQCAVAQRLTETGNTSFIQLLVRQKDDLADWISGCVGIDQKVAVRLLDLHTYDRVHNVPDIAVTPFLPLENGLLAASPWMLLSSEFERNFCAHAARQHKVAYGNASDVLAPHLAENLVAAFTKAGYKATHSIPFRVDEDQGDVDLLVWSPREHYVMAAELKWFIETADLMEVLHREKTVREEVIQYQLPKYSKLLSGDAVSLVARAFQLRSNPRIDHWSCGALVRGFVGTPRIPDDQYFFLPEPLAKERLRNGDTLQDLCEWAATKPYLPVEGQDFRMYRYEVTSPSGVYVGFWEWEEAENDTTLGCKGVVKRSRGE